MVQDTITDHFLWSPPFCHLMSHDASWGIVAKLGTRAIQRRRLHAHAMYGCWIMHEITLIGWPVTCGRDYLPITSACGATVPTVIPVLLSNAQILRRGHAAGGWSRSEDTLEECNRAGVLSLSVPFNMFKALVVLLNVLRAAITASPTQLAVVDQRSCGRDAPPKWNLPATTRLQQVGARSGDENCLRATSWRTRSHCCPCSTSELTANFFWTSAVVARWIGFDSKIDDASVQFRFCAASLRAHGSARCHNNTHAYFVSRWEKEAERNDYFRTAPTENSGPKFKFRLLHSLVKLITFQNFNPKRVNKSEMLQNFSQTQGTVFHSSACISSSEGFFKIALHTFVANHRLLAPVHHK